MFLQSRHSPRPHITGNADLKWHILLPQTLHQPRILHGPNAMPNPLRADRERIPDSLRTRSLPRMTRKAQTPLASLPVKIRIPPRRSLFLKTTEPDRHHTIRHPLKSEIEHWFRRVCAPLPSRIQNPANLHARLRLLAYQRVEHGRKILLLPQNHSRGKRHFCIRDALRLQILKQPPRRERVVPWRTELAIDPYITRNEPGKIGVRRRRRNLFERQRSIDLPQRLRLNRSFQMQVQLSFLQCERVHSCNNSGVTDAQIQAVTQGRHRDAFSFLGPHENVVRVWLPQAREAFVVAGDQVTRMEPITGAAGLFVAELTAAPGDYRIRIRLYSGESQEFEDPYRFPPLLTAFELYLHGEGTNYESYRTLGAHAVTCEEVEGARFAVWAPTAEVVSVTGDFNQWDRTRHPMRLRDGGIWEIFLPGVGTGACYKYSVVSNGGAEQDKCDPYGFYAEVPPKSASIVWPLTNYSWGDGGWMESRGRRYILREAVSTYEVHLGSWLRGPGNAFLSYRELAEKLIEYALRMGYTHLELLPVMEHPFAGSWGYQVTGYYAPTSRFGTPDDFRYFVDRCHQAGLGVILDWVPGHFPRDPHGLWQFDGTALYSHADPRQGEHREWGTAVFNFGRNEVAGFLLSNAMYWLKEFHIDGLRVDAVASMLYLDYSRHAGEWIPNRYGGRENLEALQFIRRFNELAHQVPGAMTVAEESTAWPGVSRPVYLNGLGFTMKWNMGWMHDMFHYFGEDPVFRKYHQQDITFSMLYAFTENFVLPVSHDEVVHGKRSLLSKMPGDEWQRFANVRAFLAYMFTHPGKKLMFMGCEFGQTSEWNHDDSLDWDSLNRPFHRNLQTLVRELNAMYRREPALHQIDDDYTGFEWIDFRDADASVIAFVRFAQDRSDFVVVCCNFTPVPRQFYRLGVPKRGVYREILNTDSGMFGGSNMGNGGSAQTQDVACHGHPASLQLTLPPLAVVAFKLSL